MKIYFTLIIHAILFIFSINTVIAQNYELSSPDKTINLSISINETISFSVKVDGVNVMEPSEIAMNLSKTSFGKNAIIVKEDRRTIDEILYPQLRVKSKELRDNSNELTLAFKGDYKLIFRAYNNGLAYRFESNMSKNITVQSEIADFKFPANTASYFPREKEFFSHNERLYEYNLLDTLTSKDLCSLPVLVQATKDVKLLITETDLSDYPGMWLTGGEGNSLNAVFPNYPLKMEEDTTRWPDDRSIRVTENAKYISDTKGFRSFPWRIIGISKTDADLITNQLSYQLAESSKIKDSSWIKPGKVAWDWWNFNNVYGVDFKAGVNTETYKHYIDFASEYGIEYIILDEGWYTLRDVLDIVPEVDVKEIINYGKEKNVGIILWVVWSSLDQKLEEALDTYKEWGAKGLKVDFMQRDDQWMVNYYERVARECAKRELLVDFHGSYKPAGLRRTYPNVLTREGVKGAENNKWAKYITSKHNLTIPFIRMVAGPLDYTPGAMVNAQPENYAISWNRPMSIGTRCHQIAMYVIYESPLQMLCDSPSNYEKEAESTRFISQFPTVWDDTKVLHAKLGEYLAIARKNGDKWFLGAMTNDQSRNLDIDFSFLDNGDYSIEIFQDGMNADRYASDYKRIMKKVTNKDVLKAAMAKNGGWSAIVSKIE